MLGTFTWQTQPYCNVLSLTVIQLGTLFQVVGTDNLCGTGTAAVNGSAVLSGSNVAFGLTVAHATGPASHISATISLGTISGTWTDSDGRTGAFAFNPAAPAGSARPLPTAFVPLANTLSALVSSTGTLIRGVGAVSAARAGGATGQYQVVFNRNVTTCVFTATAQAVSFDVQAAADYRVGVPNGVYVHTESSTTNNLVDNPFFVLVTCP